MHTSYNVVNVVKNSTYCFEIWWCHFRLTVEDSCMTFELKKKTVCIFICRLVSDGGSIELSLYIFKHACRGIFKFTVKKVLTLQMHPACFIYNSVTVFILLCRDKLMKTQSVLEKIIYNFVSELCSVIKTFIYLIILYIIRLP